MSWLFSRHSNAQQTARFDALLARNLEAAERAGKAAEDLTLAADASRQHSDATRAEIRETIKHRNQGPKPTTSVRTMVEDMLQHLDDQEASRREGGS